MAPDSVARDIDLIGGRFAILRNRIGPCYCNGILAQVPNGLVAENVIEAPSNSAINLLTNLGPFKEGSGAMNVLVRDNEVREAGLKLSAPLPFGAINAYGLSRANAATAAPVNRDVAIVGNRILGGRQGCIMVLATEGAEIADNLCRDTDAATRGASIRVGPGSHARLSGNRREGRGTGPMVVEGGLSQPDY